MIACTVAAGVYFKQISDFFLSLVNDALFAKLAKFRGVTDKIEKSKLKSSKNASRVKKAVTMNPHVKSTT